MINILLTGGDIRTVYAAAALSDDFRCALYGFDKLDGSARYGIPLYDGTMIPDCVVLPVNRSGSTIKCPFGSKPEITPDELPVSRKNAVIAEGSRTPEIEEYCRKHGFLHTAVLEDEALAVANAQLTAEGALAAAVNGTQTSVHGANVLVLGFGRIAKLCARYFAALGAHVTCAARKPADLAWADAMGCGTADFADEAAMLGALESSDIILNTVPAPILTGERARRVPSHTVLIELASIPCTEENTDIRVIKANGLPGKTAPASAGRYIAGTVRRILTERGN